MKAREELADIVARARRQLAYSQEIGLETPYLSDRSLAYLDRGLQQHPTPSRERLPYHSLQELEQFIGDCDRCKLSKGRKHIVFGEGNRRARLIFVGEAPGVDEDLTGKPFVGQAGKLLTDIIRSMGLTRDDVYICNIVKCHPPGNRDPEADEIETCLPFLGAHPGKDIPAGSGG